MKNSQKKHIGKSLIIASWALRFLLFLVAFFTQKVARKVNYAYGITDNETTKGVFKCAGGRGAFWRCGRWRQELRPDD